MNTLSRRRFIAVAGAALAVPRRCAAPGPRRGGGSYYLPYRLHARGDQLRAAYPRIDEFTQRNRSYDPQQRFRNMM